MVLVMLRLRLECLADRLEVFAEQIHREILLVNRCVKQGVAGEYETLAFALHVDGFDGSSPKGQWQSRGLGFSPGC